MVQMAQREHMDETDARDTVHETIHVDEAAGAVLAVSAGLLLLMTLCGWLVLFSGLSSLNSQLDIVREDRFRQLGDVNTTFHSVDLKIGTLGDQLHRIEQITLAHADEGHSRDRRLENLEQRMMRLRERTNDGDLERVPLIRDGPASEALLGEPSHKEKSR